ncbi:uncharacterized protein B0H64DRAFT_371406 [Chaetomium fimeti]|uniref:Uncharacterized protein n=1 Tax=Chaetomium fimeti TaxID=1854472 RepID=A0AAE0HM17_9PEZI|nr:hypothetical protein B0H64DRAFT_371406 [Chaetomium fimeti]
MPTTTNSSSVYPENWTLSKYQESATQRQLSMRQPCHPTSIKACLAFHEPRTLFFPRINHRTESPTCSPVASQSLPVCVDMRAYRQTISQAVVGGRQLTVPVILSVDRNSNGNGTNWRHLSGLLFGSAAESGNRRDSSVRWPDFAPEKATHQVPNEEKDHCKTSRSALYDQFENPLLYLYDITTSYLTAGSRSIQAQPEKPTDESAKSLGFVDPAPELSSVGGSAGLEHGGVLIRNKVKTSPIL